MALLDGYENELVEPPQELQWKCSICLKILREPHIVSCCGLRYCSSCIKQTQRHDYPCPHCRKRLAQVVPDAQLKRHLMHKRVYCVNKSAGCQWVGELKNAEEHARVDCIWTKVSCPNQCGQHFLQSRVDEHATEECPRRPRLCEFAAMGCDTEVLTHSRLQDHMQKSAQRHLTLACRKLEEAELRERPKKKAMVQAHQDKVKDLEGILQDREATIKQLIERVEAHYTRIPKSEAMVPDGKTKLEVMVKERIVVLFLLLAVLLLIMITQWQHIHEQYISSSDEGVRSIF